MPWPGFGPRARNISTMFVKICGITSEEDALLAVAMGADAVGFVFAPSSRQIAPSIAGDIAKRLPPEVLTVGVFRDELPPRVVEIVHAAGLRAAQLHGHETADDTRWVRERLSLVIKAFPGGDPALDRAGQFGADAILIDSATPGSGEMFDWSLAEGAPIGKRVILAGGLTPDNVGDAITRVKPWGVDVSSGVESSPGHKDARLVRDFIRNARAAAPKGYRGDEDDRPFDWQLEDFG
jgi:phosphoribosylanthranilate isomerase